MTTDYTSATINQNLKTAAAQSRSFQTNTNTAQAGAFDTVFENVAKNYTDKSEIKNSQNVSYANETKNLKTVKNTKQTKTSSQDKNILNKQDNNKTTNNTEQKINYKKENVTKSNNTEFVSSDKTIEEKTINNQIEPQEKTVLSENVSSEKERVDINKTVTNKESNDDSSIVLDNTTNEIIENDTQVEEQIQDITTEQILSNLNYTEPMVQEITQQVVTQNDNQETESEVENSNENEIVPQEIVMQAVNQVVELIPTQQQAPLNTEEGPVVESEISFVQVQDVKETQENIIQKTIQNSFEKETKEQNINVEIFSDETPVNSAEKEVRTQEKSNFDTTKLTINFTEESANSQVDEILTPDKTKAVETENTEVPVIQVTDEVAQNLQNLTEKVQNKDFAGKVKDKVTAKLSEVIGSDTLVTEVQSSEPYLQTGLNSNFQNNSSLTQGNAAEQAIKMSVENINTNETTPESFISQLNAKLNANTNIETTKQPSNLNLNKADILSQLDTKLNEMQQSGQNKVSIILKPENLGRVSVEIMNSKDGIIAKMTTDNQQVKELFDKNIEALRASLSSQGVNVNNIKVDCTHQSENNAMDFERHQFEQNSQENNNGNNNANNSKQSNETTFWESLSSSENSEEEANPAMTSTTQEEIISTETTKHNGKIDYKV